MDVRHITNLPQEYKLLRIIDLHEIHSIVKVTSKDKYKYVFAFITPKRMYYVQANDQKDMDEWFTLVNQAKEEQRLYDADDDASSIDRDQEFAKDVITSYKSSHAANQRRQSLGPYDASSSSSKPLGISPPETHEMTSNIKPVDIPKKKAVTQHHRFSPNNHTPLSEYATGHTYPLSPSSDQTTQMSMIDGIASSEDDEEYGVDKANIQSEESRNKVLIEGYLLKLGRNKVRNKNELEIYGQILTVSFFFHFRAGGSVGLCYDLTVWLITRMIKNTHLIALFLSIISLIHWKLNLSARASKTALKSLSLNEAMFFVHQLKPIWIHG